MTTKTKTKAPAIAAGAKAKKNTVPAGLAHRCLIRITNGEWAGEYMSRHGSTGPRSHAHVFETIAEALDMLAGERQEGEHFEIVAEEFEEGIGGTILMSDADVDAFFAPDTSAVLVRAQQDAKGAPDQYLTADGGYSDDESQAVRFATRLEAAVWRDSQKKYAPQLYRQFEPRWHQFVEMDVPADDPPHLMSAAEAVVQGELLPPDAGAAPAVAADVTGLEIDGAGEARLVAVALRAHAEDLAKLAKNAKALGRLAEATTMERDARLIAEELLTQLEPQTQLPFGYVDVRAALTARIHGKLRARLANQIRQDMPVLAGEQTQDREERILAKIDDVEAILGNIAEIVVSLVEPVVVEAAERGVTAGRLARETTAPALALEAAEAVERAA